MRSEIRRETVKVVEKKVYIADDGTEFDNYGKCRDYEWDKLKKPLLEKLQKCEEASGLPNCDGGYVSDCNDYEWYFVRSQEDVDILNAVFQLDLGEEDIGEWVCVETDEGCDAYFTTAYQGIRYATYLLTKLGYKVQITKG